MKTEQRDVKMLNLKSRVMWLQAKECQQPQEAGRSKEESALKPLEGVWPCQHLNFSRVILTADFRPPELGENKYLLF